MVAAEDVIVVGLVVGFLYALWKDRKDDRVTGDPYMT